MKATVAVLLALSLAACGKKDAGPQPRSLLMAGGSSSDAFCVDPAEFGALPDDGLDDRVGIQTALSTTPLGTTVCLRFGKYLVTRKGGQSWDRSAGLSIEHGVKLVGVGRGTVVEMSGDGGGPNADWRLIYVTTQGALAPAVENVEISDLTLSGAGAVNTGEQTHLVQVGVGVVRGFKIHDVWFWHPQRLVPGDAGPPVYEKGGDCLRFLGDPGREVYDSVANDNVFLDCDRSSVALQRNTDGFLLANNLFLQVGDTHIDEEPSGTGGIDNVIITGNYFTGGRQGDVHVSITGASAPVTNHVFSNNVLKTRGLSLLNVRGARVVGNVIDAVPTKPGAVLDISNTEEEILIQGNRIVRGGSFAGPVVKIRCDGAACPESVQVADNILTNATDGHVLDLDSVRGVQVTGNALRFTGPTTGTYAAVFVRATTRTVERLVVSDNTAHGALAAFFKLAASPNTIGPVSAVGNASSGPPVGLLCQGAGGFTKIVHAAYHYTGASSAASGCGAAVVGQFP